MLVVVAVANLFLLVEELGYWSTTGHYITRMGMDVMLLSVRGWEMRVGDVYVMDGGGGVDVNVIAFLRHFY